jgi:hypothetical protein
VLDKLYLVDRASLMTELVVEFVKEFNIALQRISNDSTTIKACVKYPGKTLTGLELKRGNSKDHRPDLKQPLCDNYKCTKTNKMSKLSISK